VAALSCWTALHASAVIQVDPRRDKELTILATEFWEWRRLHQPLSGDDIPRIERPDHWQVDWDPQTVQDRLRKLRDFQRRCKDLDSSDWSRPRQVDHRLLRSALARVDWERRVDPAWRRNPLFYVHQTEGALFDLLLQPPPLNGERQRALLRRAQRIPTTLGEARRNLDSMVGPFVDLAIAKLEGTARRWQELSRSLKPQLQGSIATEFEAAAERAAAALVLFRDWLQDQRTSLTESTAVGREAYRFFLHQVAVLPYEPEELVSLARPEFDRAVALEVLERHRNRDLAELPLFETRALQIKRQHQDEARIREFLQDQQLLTVPDGLRHYWFVPVPGYLTPLAHLGVLDDLTGPSRLDQDAVRYVFPPSPDLGYFSQSMARDPRPVIVHEGIPGHFLQMALSWAHENPLRRHYYDSGANEGVAFYAEEMMLQAGLFDDSPRSREILYNYMRLRALRVEVDVKLATGEFSIAAAGRYLQETVPMPQATAESEAAFFASTPGQAISYQMRLLSEARLERGENFDLLRFHNYIWKNGNLPLALLRFELLAKTDELERLDRWTRR
jgi:hypothetical protein